MTATADAGLGRILGCDDRGERGARGVVGKIGFGQEQHIRRLDLRPLVARAARIEAYGVERVDETDHAVQAQCALVLVERELIDDLACMRGATGLDQQAVGPQMAQDVADLFAELQFPDAAQTAARHQPNVVTSLGRFGNGQRVEAGVGEFIEYHDP